MQLSSPEQGLPLRATHPQSTRMTSVRRETSLAWETFTPVYRVILDMSSRGVNAIHEMRISSALDYTIHIKVTGSHV